MSEEKARALTDEEMNEVAGGRGSDLQAAYDVMNGKYGNGEERIRRLRAAGYDPYAVQALVNKLVAGWKPPVDPYLDPKTAHQPSTYRDPSLG